MAVPSEIKDRSGVAFYYGDGGDIWFPPLPLPYSYKEQVAVIRDTVIRDDDIIMTGYAKSGSHWHYEMLAMLAQGRADYVRTDKPTEMLDRLTSEQAAALTSPRVLNTHVPFRLLPRQVIQKKTKIVYLLRNPKDVAVSLYNHVRDWTVLGYQGSWPDFLQLFLYTGVWTNRWFDMARDWKKEIANHPEHPIFVAVYEEAIRDPINHVVRLNDFLGLERSRELCEKIADACSFEKLKSASHNPEIKEDHFRNLWKEGSSGFFRKGRLVTGRTMVHSESERGV
ncbi:sulfotransferase family cytosolic 1B member 1-like [Pomacea canaliculata]|uniref:sulfotransferase family cytosolic 1B member 1-like n=1 Tax=Pomacea canaliculata TaxID=400727 RepID=UPI000D735A18|nr:sulfotransferase family cytosolic 1B member 1-like [Pomacea canaliculata]